MDSGGEVTYLGGRSGALDSAGEVTYLGGHPGVARAHSLPNACDCGALDRPRTEARTQFRFTEPGLAVVTEARRLPCQPPPLEPGPQSLLHNRPATLPEAQIL